VINLGEIVAGQRYRWNLVKKLGEGDAGEVYLVESLLEGRLAILKRPRKGAYASDILRQAAQIKSEGNLLNALKGVQFPDEGTRLYTPTMLDQGVPAEGFGERFFIVIERAAGFDLKSLFRRAHFGPSEDIVFSPSAEHDYFIEKLSTYRQLPEPILVRCLLNVINLLETIHHTEILNDGVTQSGLIWNDVKPEHLFWDPVHTCLTVIDWGNGAFLETDGATKDRQHSYMDDYEQFVQEMGAFLAESNPELCARLEWPQDITVGSAYSQGVKPLKERLQALNLEVLERLRSLRSAQAGLYTTSKPNLEQLSQSDQLLAQSVEFGEIPDFSSALNFHARVALQTAAEANLHAFQQVCTWTATLPTSRAEKWELLGEIAGVAQQQSSKHAEKTREAFANTLAAGVADDWPGLLWSLFELIGKAPFPEWWERLSQSIRRVYLKLEPDAITPYVALSRLFYTLDALVLNMGDKDIKPAIAGQVQEHETLLKIFSEEVVKKWREVEPAPPHSGVGYSDIGELVEAIESILPGTIQSLEQVLAQPKAQVAIVLSAWERKDFETARKALRTLLVWDPDRRRLLRADRAIDSASQWLSKVRNGAGADEPFYDYLTSVELAGRNLRNRVGPATWLDLIRDTLKRLRKGIRPADLIMEHSEILIEIPWLNEHRSREILSLTRTRPLALERSPHALASPRTVSGTVDGGLGDGQDVVLAEPLDTWVAEARGSSARVFQGYLRSRGGKLATYAVKVMRPDRVEYALPLFREEAQILSVLRDVPGVTPLVECGFLRIAEELEFPGEEAHATAAHLRGQVERYGLEEVQNFLASMERQLASGWIPYLALQKRSADQNLMKYCDAGYNHGWFLPLRESLLLAIQICDILQVAHDRNIVYRDHKILHYYWDPDANAVAMIDWNIAKRHSEGLSDAEREFDLVQFGARALHHILTGRPAPGALPIGANRPEEIEQAALSYTVNWTYDDERLPNRVKEILAQVLRQGYLQMKDLRNDLVQVYQQIPETMATAEESNS
jgi:serine/threonine protein kinase